MPEAANPAGGSSNDTPDPMAGFRALLKEATASGGTLTDRETKLLRENYRARERLRVANEALAKAQAEGAKVPKDAVVLSKEDAETFTAFKALNVAPADIKTKLAERETLAAEKASRDGEKILDAVAEEMGLNPRAFKRLVVAEGLTVTVKTVKVEDEDSGKMVEEQVPVVRKRGAKDTDEPEELAAVLERDFAEDLDTLVASGDTGGSGDSPRASATRRSLRETAPSDDAELGQGTRFPRTRTAVPSRQSVSRKQQEEIVSSKASTGAYSL
jgi:hypothetical protein